MNWTGVVLITENMVAVSVASIVLLTAWKHRSESGVKAYCVAIIAQILWSFGFIHEIASPTLSEKVFWDNIQYIGCLIIPSALLVFSFEYSQFTFRGKTLFYALYALPSIAFLLMLFLDPMGPLVRIDARLVPGMLNGALIYEFPPLIVWMTLHSILGYLITITALIARVIRGHRLYLLQNLLITTGNFFPIFGICLSLTILADSPYRDISPITFTLHNIFIALGLFYFKLFAVIPIARNMLVEKLTDGVIVLDAQKHICDYNAAARPFSDGRHIRIGAFLRDSFSFLDSTLLLGEGEKEQQIEVLASGRYIDVRAMPIMDQENVSKGQVLVLRDITEKKQNEEELRRHRDNLESMVEERGRQLNEELAERYRIEEQFRQAQKMEAVGRLAGGIAHDFNNILSAIIGHAELLEQDFSEDPNALESINTIQNVSIQAAGLIQQLLAFSRKQVLQPKVLDINEEIWGVQKMLGRLMGEDIALVLDLDPSLGPTKADPVQFQQVIMNLAVNARDAMPTGGKFTITTSNIVVDESNLKQYMDLSLGAYIRISCSDTGSGMGPETVLNIFEPFFTTKGMGKGTGLGLATVHGIVKQSGGSIQVQSKLGEGSTFIILLPRIDAVIAPVSDSRQCSQLIRGTGETILVVEDEVFVLNLVRRVLGKAGYRVLEATEAKGALSIIQGYPGQIAVLLTDVVLPGVMSGKELADEMLALHPHIRVLYMSGYTGDKITERGLAEENINFIAKPFSPAQLLATIHRILAESAE